MFRGMVQGRGNWVRESEHIVLRLVSLAFSIGSAYAVRWFFEPLDAGDPIHYALWWVVAAGFGLLGFYLSRSLMHRMMSKEPIWAYAPIFLLVEFFEILCNYAKAVSAVAGGNVSWVIHAPAGQQVAMIFLTYVGWSILPLVSPAMAVADMDMTRRRNGEVVVGAKPRSQAPQPQGLRASQLTLSPQGQGQQQPRWGGQPQQGAPKQAPNNGAASSPQAVPQQRPVQPQQGQRPAQPQGGVPNNSPLPGIARPAQVSS